MQSMGDSQSVAVDEKEEALWLLEHLSPNSAANNLSVAFHVPGVRLDVPALQRTLAALFERHEVLRTVFLANGASLSKRVLPSAGVRLEVEVVEAPVQPQDVALREFAACPLPLDGGLLARPALFRYPEGDAFCLVVHHLVFDVTSGEVLLDELVARYGHEVAGGPMPAGLAEPPHRLVEPGPGEESLAFWSDQLRGFDPGGVALTCGRDDVAQPTFVGDQLTRRLSDEVAAAVRGLCKTVRAPEAAILVAAYAMVLGAHGGGSDLTVGMPVDVRPPDQRRAVGYHVNVLPLRIRTDPSMTLRQLVRHTREVYFGSLMHTDVPADHLAKGLPRSTATARTMLFRHVLNYVPGLSDAEFTIAGSPATRLLVENGYSKFDLEFFVMSAEKEITLRVAYRSEILDRADVERMVERFEAVLQAFAADPERRIGDIPVWSRRDREVIDSANETTVLVSPTSVPEAVYTQVVAAPRAVAVQHGDRSLTYRQLWEAATRLADRLRAADVQSGQVVAVAGRRSAGLVCAVLGCWLADAAYLPVDPDHPPTRILHQLTDSGATVVLADPALELPTEGRITLWPDLSDLPVPAAEPARPSFEPLSCAYLIYTSGSTGTPKGTWIPHLALANATAHFVAELAAGPDAGMLWMTTFAFDISALELFVPLTSGGRVVVAPDDVRTNGDALRQLIERERVRTIQATPTTWRLICEKIADGLRGRQVLCGGEPLPISLAETLVGTGCELHHVYGPTETTIWSTSTVIGPEVGPRIDIGRPIRNTQIMVLDGEGREMPVGMRGEVCIAGSGVALGYHNRPELNAERFGQHPVFGKFYRTGDVGHWRPDGTLELFGRSDRQIKLRGNRIELGEIEAALLKHAQVKAVAVVVVGERDTDAELAAFVEAAANVTADELWSHARNELAAAMIPQHFTIVDELPTNANGKVDYPALVRTAEGRLRERVLTEPVGEEPLDDEATEQIIDLCRQLLDNDKVTAETHFFLSGGTSLLAALLAQRIEEATGVSLRLAEVFEDSTPRAIAARVRAAKQKAAGDTGEHR